jgi:FkbM family methyltransferase
MGRGIDAVLSRGPIAALRRGVRALIYEYRARSFRPYVIGKSLAGENFLFLIGDVDASYMYDRVHDWPELAFVSEHLIRPGDVVADCGANHGVTGVVFARRVGKTGRVIGFEPSPKNVEVARVNARLNGASNLEIREVALGASPGTTFFLPEMNGHVTHAADPRAIVVPRTTLDDAFPDQAPNLLKIDVEGSELEVLAGARRVMSTLPKFDIEVHVAEFSDARRALRELIRSIPLAEYEVHLQRTIDGPITKTVLGDRVLDDLARLSNVHLFGIPKRDVP